MITALYSFFICGWKFFNLTGVDLNLQFPAGWEQAREIKRVLKNMLEEDLYTKITKLYN